MPVRSWALRLMWEWFVVVGVVVIASFSVGHVIGFDKGSEWAFHMGFLAGWKAEGKQG